LDINEALVEIVELKERLRAATDRITELNSEAVQQELLIETLRDQLNYYTAREYDRQQDNRTI
jgi:uncharacterized coiled-coil protein SlyX